MCKFEFRDKELKIPLLEPSSQTWKGNPFEMPGTKMIYLQAGEGNEKKKRDTKLGAIWG